MGERQSGDAELEARIAAAIRQDRGEPEGEQRAVAAFRAARDAGTHHAVSSRSRDDWRPRKPWRARLSVKTTLSVFLASLTLGGVAVAAIGPAGFSSGGTADGLNGAHPSTSVPEQSTAPSADEQSAASAHLYRPDTAKDTLAHCRAYDQVKDRGNAMDATAWQRLVAAAGGEENVAAYCAAQLRRAAGNGTDKGNTGKGDKPNSPGIPGTSGKSGESGETGNADEKVDTAPRANSAR